MPLSPQDLAILELERSWWQTPGHKGDVIRDRLAMSPSAYYRRLSALIDRHYALCADPLLVRRLRRNRTERRRTRHTGPRRQRSQP